MSISTAQGYSHIDATNGLSWPSIPSPTAAQAGTSNTTRAVSAAENSGTQTSISSAPLLARSMTKSQQPKSQQSNLLHQKMMLELVLAIVTRGHPQGKEAVKESQ
ncbi:uncharacterized protein LOC112512017 isoform X2 [Cynara cardunculus var. scolymus]|uniref:uncharacterized protein LOC112512017 isoform X2 n=1 Tax=Cynara cardunculus var. scolymus TaxID=59895 RepID=UPI000D6309FC|nr:uncharacterized protein LOC112512017 isoform X2 [Cynara cardunculus var. scolymus]